MHIIPLLLCSINKTIFFQSCILFFSVRINWCNICATCCSFLSPCPLVPPMPAIVKDPKPLANHVVARQRMQPMRMAKTIPQTQRVDASNRTHSTQNGLSSGWKITLRTINDCFPTWCRMLRMKAIILTLPRAQRPFTMSRWPTTSSWLMKMRTSRMTWRQTE